MACSSTIPHSSQPNPPLFFIFIFIVIVIFLLFLVSIELQFDRKKKSGYISNCCEWLEWLVENGIFECQMEELENNHLRRQWRLRAFSFSYLFIFIYPLVIQVLGIVYLLSFSYFFFWGLISMNPWILILTSTYPKEFWNSHPAPSLCIMIHLELKLVFFFYYSNNSNPIRYPSCVSCF